MILPKEKKNVVVFDLDGTLALIDHRRHFVTNGRTRWDLFYEACDQDEPNIPVIRMLQTLVLAGCQVMIVSARSDQVKDKTIAWLTKYVVKPNMGILLPTLVMRPAKDSTPDDVLKLKWLNDGTIPRDRVLCVFDDRNKVVAMWRTQGISCFQVAPGDF